MPKKIIVWGPGGLGQACIREIARLPELDLVGVLAYSPEKDGMDAGDLVGLPSLGVAITTDKEKIFATPADCVLVATALLPDNTGVDADVIRLLESGKNVISGANYHYPPAHGNEYAARFEAACQKGKSSLHGTGINPGFVLERMGVTATGLSNRIDMITTREVTDCSDNPLKEMMEALGFGLDPTTFDPGGPVMQSLNHYFVEALQYTSDTIFGQRLDRIESYQNFIVADEDVETACMTITKGSAVAVQYFYTGYIGDAPRLRMEQHWYQNVKYNPVPEATTPDYKDIVVEGEPCSLRIRMDLFASVRKNTHHSVNDPTFLTYYATGVPMLQAIPQVCDAEPGIVYQKAFSHRRPDLSMPA